MLLEIYLLFGYCAIAWPLGPVILPVPGSGVPVLLRDGGGGDGGGGGGGLGGCGAGFGVHASPTGPNLQAHARTGRMKYRA